MFHYYFWKRYKNYSVIIPKNKNIIRILKNRTENYKNINPIMKNINN